MKDYLSNYLSGGVLGYFLLSSASVLPRLNFILFLHPAYIKIKHYSRVPIAFVKLKKVRSNRS